LEAAPVAQSASAGFWANQGAVPPSEGAVTSLTPPAQPVEFGAVAPPAAVPAPASEPAVEAVPENVRPKDRAEVFRATRAQLDDIFSPRPAPPAVAPSPTAAAPAPPVAPAFSAPVEESSPAWASPTSPAAVPFAAAELNGPQPPSLASNMSAPGGNVPPLDSAAASEELVRRFAPAPQESLLEQVGFATSQSAPSTTFASDALPPAPAPAASWPADPLAPMVGGPSTASTTPATAVAAAPAPAQPAPALDSIFGGPAPAVEPPAEEQVSTTPTGLTTASLTSGSNGPQAAPLDIEASMGRIGDDVFWSELITMYRREVEDRLSTIERALKLGDEEAVRHEAHTIKGSSAELVLEGMRGYAMQLEKQAQAGDLGTAATTALAMRQEFERFKRYLAERRPELA
jgi:HPt (histidine-containing phosphotransfer) domain-containing protein